MGNQTVEHKITNEMLFKVINTLKEIDVRGFESMNRLVGFVMFFEGIINSPSGDGNEVK